MARIGRTFTDRGWRLSSGDAIGADYAFYVGARLSPGFDQAIPRIYLSRNGYGGRREETARGFINAQRFDTYAQARKIAEDARGGFYNLSEFGIELHTRNVFQIMGHSLTDPVSAVYFYAKPRPKNPEKVQGGTSTAIEIAKHCGIVKRYNLFYETVQAAALGWLANNESPSPYPDDLLDMIHSRRLGTPVM